MDLAQGSHPYKHTYKGMGLRRRCTPCTKKTSVEWRIAKFCLVRVFVHDAWTAS